MTKRFQHHSSWISLVVISLIMAALLGLFGCGGSGGSSGSGGSGGSSSSGATTSGSKFVLPSTVLMSPYTSAGAIGTPEANIDISSVSKGYVAAAATSASRLKLQVKKGDMTYNYDMPNNGTPVVAPINMDDGTYQIAIMQNTTENRYMTLVSTSVDVKLESMFEPFLRPNIFCNYTPESPVVAKARELVANAENEGDALGAIYDWIVTNVKYDKAKASELAGKTGYIPNPDSTLETRTGICFDYASLAAAMLRSIGIPCEIITGYVSPNGIYHAWNLVWINGSWKTVSISVDPQTWTRVDMTFAAGGDTSTVGDGSRYEQRYVY